ncbi:MAG: ATP-binding protein [Eggerthellaceae bacterium]|jgi:signal transduction histidine kinase|nr:ATP-binding protein [Eggerthellaceae bacterium]MDR2715533.1 GAF domain-containing protein [Coriobacteriaceae bacterium]
MDSIGNVIPAEQAQPRYGLEELIRLSEAVALSPSSEVAHQRMVEDLATIFECDFVNLYLLSNGGDIFVEKACCDRKEEKAVAREGVLHASKGRIQKLIDSHEPIVMFFNSPHEEDEMPVSSVDQAKRVAVSIPLVAGDEVVGIVNFSNEASSQWTKDRLDYLLLVGNMLGAIVKQRQIMQKQAALQMLIERRQLSAEIHDNLAQLISLVSIGIDSALESVDECDYDAVQRNLERLREASKQAHAIIREEILYLRAPVSQTEGLVAGIRGCLNRVSEQWDIDIHFDITKVLRPVILSDQNELQTTRILHEALSNAIRHSGATEILVVLEAGKQWVTLRVEDNGCGFDPALVPAERLGLKIMKERAESFGGKFSLQSKPGSGTAVFVDIPI